MSVKKYCRLLHDTRYRAVDKQWFPRWVRRYASTLSAKHDRLSITVEDVVRFSRLLRDNGTPAWQRLQAVRAVESYRNLVIRSTEPSLADIRKTLSRISAKEKVNGTEQLSRPGVNDERHLIGIIDPAEPAIIQNMRNELRLQALWQNSCRLTTRGATA